MVTHDIAVLRKRAADLTLSAAERECAQEVLRAWEQTCAVYSPTTVTVCHRGEQLIGELLKELGPLPGRSGE